MNILWITNIVMPEAESLLTSFIRLSGSGGWMVGLSESLSERTSIKLYIATVTRKVASLTKLRGKTITYYLLPSNNYELYWKKVKEDVCPDVVHLHGTEYPWGKSYIDVCGTDNVVVSIQGLLSSYYNYYYYGLTKSQILQNITLGSMLGGGILKGYRQFKKDSNREIELLRHLKHVIGRTTWDRSHTWAINPNADYHFCNEVLRKEFYDGSKWNFESCQRFTIFLSQGTYPIKGLHQVLKALPFIKRHFPEVQLRIAGRNITQRKGLKGILRYSDYSKIIKKMISKLHLEGHVFFTGELDADGMKREYLNANVFVCPSSIENSPNSLGEAQILGVPCVAANVGGVADMIPDSGCGEMYRFEEVECLAKAVCDIFSKNCFEDQLHMIKIATQRHDPINNTQVLVDIYEKICRKC